MSSMLNYSLILMISILVSFALLLACAITTTIFVLKIYRKLNKHPNSKE